MNLSNKRLLQHAILFHIFANSDGCRIGLLYVRASYFLVRALSLFLISQIDGNIINYVSEIRRISTSNKTLDAATSWNKWISSSVDCSVNIHFNSRVTSCHMAIVDGVEWNRRKKNKSSTFCTVREIMAGCGLSATRDAHKNGRYCVRMHTIYTLSYYSIARRRERQRRSLGSYNVGYSRSQKIKSSLLSCQEKNGTLWNKSGATFRRFKQTVQITFLQQ